MRHVARLVLNAVHTSRKRQAELFIRRYSHVIAEVRASERRREIDLMQDGSASRATAFEPRAAS
jgi:hypothetical protein